MQLSENAHWVLEARYLLFLSLVFHSCPTHFLSHLLALATVAGVVSIDYLLSSSLQVSSFEEGCRCESGDRKYSQAFGINPA